MWKLESDKIQRAVRAALDEDVGTGDATSIATIPEDSTSRAVMVVRHPAVLAGIEFARETFRQVSESVRISSAASDGTHLPAGGLVMEISGPSRAVLTGERVALNFVQRLSGVATLTSRFVKEIEGTGAAILDTRKTTPGWRRFEKYAVACGGGRNHRFGLFDMILIKDNHLAALRDEKPNAIAAAVRRARQRYPNLKVEVEADTLEQAGQAADAGADIILLDNMPLESLREAVRINGGRAKLEASGGVNLQTVRAIAETGVDYISAGAITHSAPAADIGLDFKVT